VIYTSGSTGRPKGVMVEHRSVVRLVIDPDFVPLGADTVMLQASAVSFDAATFEIWGALLNGGRLVLYDERVPEIAKLNAVIERHAVNTLWLTAGLFEPWSHQVPRASPLRWVLSGGDVVNPLAVARVHAALPGVEVVNGYGPTENTTFTSCHAIPRGFDPGVALPLGRPIHGTGVYVLQENGGLAAPGAIGEIYALGDGVARGYLNDPRLTAERFVANPYPPRPPETACTGPETWLAGVSTGRSNFWAGGMARSRSGVSASSWERSRRSSGSRRRCGKWWCWPARTGPGRGGWWPTWWAGQGVSRRRGACGPPWRRSSRSIWSHPFSSCSKRCR
jgi:non-ribosomal peptide synthetase component F